MCCFSRPVEHVAETQIFARKTDKGRQVIVYSMTINAKEDLAMILPIPVPEKSAEDAVKFVNLEKYPEFFKDMKKGFPEAESVARSPVPRSVPTAKAEPLAVVEVGSFDASFVPSVGDFSRLDERFRLPEAAWDDLPQYKTFGFAVFKLKAGNEHIHPMAFDFPVADDRKLFFPTVHIHDGEVHEEAEFDHQLYCQIDSSNPAVLHWRESDSLAETFVDIKRAQKTVNPDDHVYQTAIRGLHKNEDTLV